jgi:hypothetical protein
MLILLGFRLSLDFPLALLLFLFNLRPPSVNKTMLTSNKATRNLRFNTDIMILQIVDQDILALFNDARLAVGNKLAAPDAAASF